MSKRTLGLLVACALSLGGAAQAQTTLRVVNHSDLKIIDPIWTTAYIVRNHGYMIYDTLFALDGNLEVKPQMVDKWSTSDDKLTWTFTLRDGLEFHDGAPVTAEDVVPSLKRWAVRDPLGQMLWTKVDDVKAVDAKTFQILLKAPTGIMLQALGKPSGNPFIMPKRIAETDPFKQIEDATGSGPFIFVKNEWKPGEKTVYVKNPKYKPRSEPPSGLAGGKIAKVDRVEWVAMSDQQTVGERAAQGRDRHDRIAAARSLQGHGGRQERQAGQPQQVGQPVHLPLQPALQAVRQRQDPPGAALRLQPEGLSRRRDRRSQVVQDLQGDVHVRHALRQLQGLRGQVRFATSTRPASS